MDILWWYTTIAIVASVGQTLFVLLYMTFPWFETFLGKALFIKALTLALLLDVALAGTLWDWPHEEIWIVGLYGLTSVGIWAQFAAFLVQRFGRKDHTSTKKKREYHHGTR